MMKTNNKIYIIAELYCGHIHGSFIDCLDTYYNLKSAGYLCELVILVHLQYVKPLIKRLNTLYTPVLANDIVKHISSNINAVSPDDIIICKYESINNGIIDYNKYKNIYIINDLNLTNELVSGQIDIDLDKIESIKGIFATPFLKQYTNKVIVDYMKFSQFRLDNMRITNKLGIFDKYEEYDLLKREQYFNVHNYKELVFKRRYYGWIEIKGKLIFEFLYFNKKAHYSPVNKSMNDGLTDYLLLFGIDDNIEQYICISKEEIEDKLVLST